jgi:hypothetical protein
VSNRTGNILAFFGHNFLVSNFSHTFSYYPKRKSGDFINQKKEKEKITLIKNQIKINQ